MMTPHFRIATARPFDVSFFASIEREAAQLLEDTLRSPC